MPSCFRYPISFLLIFFITGFSFSRSGAVNIESYDITAALHSVNDTLISVKVICNAVKLDGSPVIFMLLNNQITKPALSLNKGGVKYELQFEFSGNDTIQIRFPEGAYEPGPFSITFAYGFPIDAVKDNMVLIDRGHRWYPLIAEQISKVKLTAVIPGNCGALSAGNLHKTSPEFDISKTGTKVVTWECNSPVFKIPLIIYRLDKFKKFTSVHSGMEISLVTTSADTALISGILDQAGGMLAFCNDNIGAYIYDKLTICEVPEFPGINIGSGLIQVGSEYFDEFKRNDFEGLHLAIAEQWFGAAVFAQYGQPGFWFMALSLPHYVRIMHTKETKGEQAYNDELQEALDKYKEFAGTDNDVPILNVDYPNTKEKGIILYGKGPYVISLLNEKMGDYMWKAFLSALFTDFEGKMLSYPEFCLQLSKQDSDGKLMKFFNNAMTTKGFPK